MFIYIQFSPAFPHFLCVALVTDSVSREWIWCYSSSGW